VPKFKVEIEFDLESQIEPDGIRFYEPEGVEDYEDSSYFQSAAVEVYGGAVGFDVEAEDEDAAERVAHDVVYDGMEVEDDNGLTWQAVNVKFTVEVVEIPMDLVRAKLLVEAYLDQMEGMDDDLKEAFGFLLSTVYNQANTITDHRAEITRLDSVVARQAGEIDRLVAEAAPQPQLGEVGL